MLISTVCLTRWITSPRIRPQWEDDDLDGLGSDPDGRLPDSCRSVWGDSWRDRFGCPDDDQDGQSDLNDAFPNQITQWTDADGDLLGDNWEDVSWARSTW